MMNSDGPREGGNCDKSRQIASRLWKHMPNINQSAAEYGALMQNSDSEKYRWIQLVADVIENQGKYIKVDSFGRDIPYEG